MTIGETWCIIDAVKTRTRAGSYKVRPNAAKNRSAKSGKGGNIMFGEAFDAVTAAAENKLSFMRRSPVGYFFAGVLAGMFVAFGGFVSATVGGALQAAESPWTRPAAAFAFASALSLVIMAGSELFTGNNLVMTAGVLEKRVKAVDAMKLWLFCWLANYAGSWLAAALYYATGLVSGTTAAYIASLARTKLFLSVPQMFVRGILCNMLVCLAVWCSFKMKSESGKLIMVFWCILIFMVCGFEHSVANMSSLAVALLMKEADFWHYVVNIGMVTLGNIIGGALFVAVPYWLCRRK